MRTMGKRCSSCEKFKPIGHFSKNKCMKSGRINICKSCIKAQKLKRLEFYPSHRDIIFGDYPDVLV